MNIIELFQYAFFRNALLGSLFASIACGIIGTYVVTRRLVFISGGITHASFGGIGNRFLFWSSSCFVGYGLLCFFQLSASSGYQASKTFVKTLPLPSSGRWEWQ